jgi:protein phosphatase
MASPSLRRSEIQIEVAQLSDPGRDPNKQINEDSCGYTQTKFGHLCVLCDGMGGHYGGQEASRRAITTIFEQIELAPEGASPAQALKMAIEVAGRRVYELGGPPDNKVRPGSTVVAMLLHERGVDVAHVGDSRAYVIRANQIYPLTRDHSMVQAMIDAGFLTEDQAIGHPDANKITRALGMKPDVDVEVRPDPMELFPGDVLLTTSDGLTDLALSRDILGATRQALASGGLEHACQQLVRMANDRGGHDNITVQLARVLSTAAQPTQAGSATPTGADHGSPPPAASAPAMQQGQIMGAGAHAPSIPVETLNEPRLRTVTAPMHPSPTAHDGGHDARGLGASAMGHEGHAAAPLPLPPMGVSPTMPAESVSFGPRPGETPQAPGFGPPPTPAPGLAGYRLDAAGGLPLPPASTRFAHAGGPGPSYPSHPTPAMTPAPNAFGHHGLSLSAGAPGAAFGPGGYGGGPHSGIPVPSHSSPSAVPSSASSMRGGGVVYLILGASFGLAVVIMLLVWALFLR